MNAEQIAQALAGKGYRAYNEDNGDTTIVAPNKQRWVIDKDGSKVGRGRHFRQGQLEGESLDVFQNMRSDPKQAQEIAKAMASGSTSEAKSWDQLLG